MLRLYLVLLVGGALLAACAPGPYVARYRATARVCGWTLERPTFEGVWDVPLRDPPCVDRVLADLAVDTEAFLAADGLLDPYAALEPDPPATRLTGLLGAIAVLGGLDLGPLGDAPPLLREVLAPVAAATGERAVGPLLYDWLAGGVTVVRPGHDPRVWATLDPATGVLTVDAHLSGIDGVGILVHEARHTDGLRHVPCRSNPERSCDEGAGGAYGVERAFHLLVARRTDDLRLEVHEREAAAACADRIEP